MLPCVYTFRAVLSEANPLWMMASMLIGMSRDTHHIQLGCCHQECTFLVDGDAYCRQEFPGSVPECSKLCLKYLKYGGGFCFRNPRCHRIQLLSFHDPSDFENTISGAGEYRVNSPEFRRMLTVLLSRRTIIPVTTTPDCCLAGSPRRIRVLTCFGKPLVPSITSHPLSDLWSSRHNLICKFGRPRREEERRCPMNTKWTAGVHLISRGPHPMFRMENQ